MKKPTFYVNPVYPQPERQTGTIWEQAAKKKRAKYLIYKYLTLFLVPRPGVEPGWMLLHWCLRPARLPIPPSGLIFILRCKDKHIFHIYNTFEQENVIFFMPNTI